MAKEDEKNSKESRGGWEDLFFGALDKLAQASDRIKDPQGNVSAAFEWMKGMKSELQDRMSKEFADRVAQIDWQKFAKVVGDQLAEKYDIEIQARVSLKPKTSAQKPKENETTEAGSA